MQSTPSERPPRPRQEPVSCENCRKRKLKCSREQPCSNCVTRDVPCEFAGRRMPVTSVVPAITDDARHLRAENTAIKARLERLEEIIFSGEYRSEVGSEDRPVKARRLAKPDSSMLSPSTTVSNSSDSEAARNYKGEVRWLEGVGTVGNGDLAQLSVHFSVRVCSCEEIAQWGLAGRQERCILLPPKDDAIQLVDAYIEQLDPLQHLIHPPATRRAICQLYKAIRLHRAVDANRTVLLLISLMAGVSAYWGLAETSVVQMRVFSTPPEALNAANYWIKATMDMLEHVRRTGDFNLENVQASMLICFLIYHIEGFSPKTRAMLHSSVAAAKEIALHRTDCPPMMQVVDDPVGQELRRRIWWHLASTDWSLSLVGGPHEGTYIVNPRHMHVNRPRNISDEELEAGIYVDHPPSKPTVMAYYLQRIRLAEISRQITDMTSQSGIYDIPVEDVKALDAKFEAMLRELPDFIRLDPDSGHEFEEIDRKHPYIPMQRYFLNLIFQARRCKLHLPFLLRATHDPSYAFSREACLRSARALLRLKKSVALSQNTLWLASSRLCGILHIFFYATIVLVMDLCVNRAAGDETERKAEIQEACKTLEHAKRQSSTAGMFLDSLMAILRKHRIRLHGENERTTQNLPVAEEETLMPAGSLNDGMLDDHIFGNLNFDELWQSYINLDTSVDPQSWDALISDVETHID